MAKGSHQVCGWPFHCAAAHDGRDGDIPLSALNYGVSDSGDRQDWIDRHERIAGRDDHAVSVLDCGEHSRSRASTVGASKLDMAHSVSVLAFDEVTLKVDRLATGQSDASAHSIVAHGQDVEFEVPCGRNLASDVGKGCTFVEALGAIEMCAKVSVAQSEPRLPAVAVKSFLGLPGLADQAPTRLWVDDLGQGVGAGIEVRADRKTMQTHVVGGIDDCGDV